MPVYGPTAVYVAPEPGAPAEGPFVAPADVLMTDARYRSKQAATTQDPFVAVYGADVKFADNGKYSVLSVTKRAEGGLRRRHGRDRGLDQGRLAGPGGRREGAEDPHRHAGERRRRRREDRHAPAAFGHAHGLRRRGGQEAGRAAVLHPAAVRFARVRAGHRHRAADAVQVRRPDDLHPPGGLRRQRRQQGPARAAEGSSACRASRGCSWSMQAGRSRPGSRARSASQRSRTPSSPACETRVRGAAAALAAAVLVPGVAEAHGLVQRQQLPIPQWLFAWAAAAVLVISFFALAVLWPQPRLERDDWRPLPGGRGFASTAAAGAVGRDRRAAAGRHGVGRLSRQRDRAGQLGADVPADHVLGRAGVRLDPVRRDLPGVLAVPGAGRAAAVAEPAVPGAAGALAGGDRAVRLHLGRARVGLGRGPGDARHRRAGLHGADAGGAGLLRRRDLDALRGGLRGLLRHVRADVDLGDAGRASWASGGRWRG